MGFDFLAWRQAVGGKLRQLDEWLEVWRRREVRYMLYGGLCSLSLWPLVEAARSGEPTAAILALGSVAGSVGANLVAEQIQRWTDNANKVQEDDIVSWVAAQASDSDLRAVLDDILTKLDVLSQAITAVPNNDRDWFVNTLRNELTQLGNAPRFEGALAPGIVTAVGTRGVAVGSVKDCVIITGDHNEVVG